MTGWTYDDYLAANTTVDQAQTGTETAGHAEDETQPDDED